MKRKIKIGIFIRNFQGGGAERVAVNVANELSKTQEVVIFVVDATGPYLKEISPLVPVIQLGPKRLILSAPALRSQLKLHHIDCLISNLTHENIVAALAVLGTDIRLLAVEHNNFNAELSSRGRANFLITKFLFRLMVGRFDALIAVSEGLKKELSNLYPNRAITRIYNPIIDDKNRLKLSNCHTRPHAKAYVVFVGRLTTQKDPLLAIRAYHLLVSQYDYKGDLLLLGEGPLEKDARGLSNELGLQGRVQFLGFQDNPYQFMKYADLLLLTSRWEGFGNVLVEAIQSGTSVVSTDCRYGPAEIIRDGVNGYLVTEFSPSAIAKKMADAMQLDPQQALYGMDQFHIEHVVNQYAALALS